MSCDGKMHPWRCILHDSHTFGFLPCEDDSFLQGVACMFHIVFSGFPLHATALERRCQVERPRRPECMRAPCQTGVPECADA